MLLSKYKREPEAWNKHVVPYYESETASSSAYTAHPFRVIPWLLELDSGTCHWQLERRHRRASWFHPSPKAAAVMLTRGLMQFTYYSQQHLILCFFPVSTASHFCIRLTLKFCKLQIYPKSTIAKREELIQIFVFNWTIALQCCVHFCYTSKGISCRYMYVSPSFQNSFPPPTVFHPF